MKFITSLILIFTGTLAFGQQFIDNSLGNYKKHSRSGQSVIIETTNGRVKIDVYSAEIIKFHISKQTVFDEFSYSVIAKPQNVPYTINENNTDLSIVTDSLIVKFSRNPVRFSVYNKTGVLISADDVYGTTWVGEEVTTFKKLQDGEKFVGLGEKTGNLNRRGEGYTNWNSDTPGYTVNQDPIYSSFPFYIGIHHNVCYGIFFDNSHKSYFNFGASNDRFSSFGADAGEMVYYYIGGSTVSQILTNYSKITGTMPMPPLWALGFQQSRWSYFPDIEVINIAQTFREKKIPLDVMYLDIHYMDAYKVFTWHPERFSNPNQLTGKLKDMGVRTAVIIDPGIKVEKGYKAYEDGLKNDMFLKYPDGTPYAASVWPGLCNFPDFTKPAAREWWGKSFSVLTNAGVEGYWNDMNEIASWGAGKTPSLVRMDWEGKGASYRQAKNLYGTLMARSTYEGVKTLLNKRPLIITRAAFAGAQRYTSIWTGDNVGSEEHMMLGCRLVNSLGLTGMPFCGTDVGGFMNSDASATLFSRWVSVGTFTPFFRVHKNYDFKMSEPWSYGSITEDNVRNYISLRYKLLPYIYSAFYAASNTGIPIAKSLAIDYTFDEKVFYNAYQNEYLFGPSLLVAPVESTKELTKVYFPEGDWYDFFTGQKYEGNSEVAVECPLEKLPVFAKAGSIIPMQSLVQSTSEKPSDTLFIHVYFSADRFDYQYYEDDGESYDFEKGISLTKHFIFDGKAKQLTLAKMEGNYNSKFSKIQLILHGFENCRNIKVNGAKVDPLVKSIDLYGVLNEKDALYTFTKKFLQSVMLLNINRFSDQTIITWE